MVFIVLFWSCHYLSCVQARLLYRFPHEEALLSPLSPAALVALTKFVSQIFVTRNTV